MKAHVYAVFAGARGEAHVSVAPKVDELYWSHQAFREGIRAGWGTAADESMVRDGKIRLLWLPEPLPLGIAVSVRERLAQPAAACRSLAELQARMADAMKWARKQCGKRLPEEDWDEAEDEPDDRMLRAASGLPPGEIRDIGHRIGRLARELAEKLRGRQLLEAEAACLVPGHAGVSLHVLLQVASLMGNVCLLSGVAPVEESEVSRRKWRHRIRMPSWLRMAPRPVWRCRRCGSAETGPGHKGSGGRDEMRPQSPGNTGGIRRTPCASCGRMQCAYCEMCLTMGRSRECGLLVIGAPSASGLRYSHPVRHYLDGWGLSPPQREASGAALSYLLSGGQSAPAQRRRLFPRIPRALHERTFLLWAVTGAGKTEMLFPLLQAVLEAGGRAAVAAPRRDVVLELAPRLAKAFPQASLAVLHGESSQRFESAELTLATTHQLIRFRQAFDLVVIDEVDAFPYHNDPMLQYAASGARAERGITVLLSATPPAAMQRDARRRKLPAARVPVRHHGRPLPVPRRLSLPPMSRWAQRAALPAPLAAALRRSAARGAQIFLFVPYIRQVEPLVRCLRQHADKLGLGPEAISGTSSQDPERTAKVTAFRARNIRLLVTTTILERGVTIPKSDVFVLDADRPLFDAAALVQMAGRAGRAADDPDGLVYFAAPAWTAAQREARRQIREMNREARKKGYLLPMQKINV